MAKINFGMLVAYLTSGFLKAFGGTAGSLRSATFLTTTQIPFCHCALPGGAAGGIDR